MTNARAPLAAVAVVGAGPIAYVAALVTAKAVPTARITIVRPPADPAALADRFPTTLPGSSGWLADAGLDEAHLVADGVATHRVGIRFAEWGEDARDWTFAHGSDVALPLPGALPLLWLAHGRDVALRYEDVRPAAALAAADRFAAPLADRRSLLDCVDAGLRLDAARLLPLLDRRARAAGIAVRESDVVATQRSGDGGLASITLANGTTIAADLFVDATGPRALLAATKGETAADWCGCDRLLIAERPGDPAPADAIRAVGIGWRGDRPLADRITIRLAYAADTADEAQARRLLDAGDAEAVALPPPRHRPPFAAKVLALGEAGTAIDPLGDFGFALAERQLALFAELLPSRDRDPLLAAEYNRRAGLAADRIGTVVASLHAVRPRRRGPFWRARTGAVPAALDAFAERGVLPQHDDQSVTDADWRAALLGLGIVPRQHDAVARSADPARVRALIADLAAAVAALPATLPPYPALLADPRTRV